MKKVLGFGRVSSGSPTSSVSSKWKFNLNRFLFTRKEGRANVQMGDNQSKGSKGKFFDFENMFLWHQTKKRSLSTNTKSNSEEQQSKSFFDEWKTYTFPTALGFLAIAFVYIRRKEVVPGSDKAVDAKGEPKELKYYRPHWDNLVTAIMLYVIPTKELSSLFGRMAATEIPSKLVRKSLFMMYGKMVGINFDEIELPVEEYKSFNEFFTRNLKEGARTINFGEDIFVSPVDGTVSSLGSIDIAIDEATRKFIHEDVIIEKVKGKNYTLRHLLGDMPMVANFQSLVKKKLNYIVVYLAPEDYHHFHSPVDFTLCSQKHVAGVLLPVREPYISKILDLYVRNERVALQGSWKQGFFAYVAVGAFNVGSISLCKESKIENNNMCQFIKGERVGTFNLGSTVVLMFESDENFHFLVEEGQKIKLGLSIGSLV